MKKITNYELRITSYTLMLLWSYGLTVLKKRRFVLTMLFLYALMVANAQIDKTGILEKLKLELLPQVREDNPFKYPREKYIIQCLESNLAVESDDCEKVNEVIEKFMEIDKTGGDTEKIEYIRRISRFQCREAFRFLETQIKNNPSLAVRCDALVCLAWSLNPDYLPCMVEYGKRETLSIPEKLSLAGAYTIYGIYTAYPALKEEAVKLLNEVCYQTPSDEKLQYSCIWTYYKLGGAAAKNYYISLLEQKELEDRVSVAAYGLAPLGEYETIFPIFAEAIRSEVPHNILCAIDGLRVMGTAEALRLIEEQTRSKDEKIAGYAKEALNSYKIKKGD